VDTHQWATKLFWYAELHHHKFRRAKPSQLSAKMTARKRLKIDPAPIGEMLLTLREAASVLRMNPRTLRAYLRRGEIEGRVIGGKWRFRRIDLDRFYEDAPRNWDFRGNRERED
jgi:excisionase family DNA binding protein